MFAFLEPYIVDLSGFDLITTISLCCFVVLVISIIYRRF